MTESPVKLPRQRARGFPVRDLKVRQMDALKDWLRAGPWTVPEAACLIAGVLPPERMGDTSDFGGVLPGREGWENAREAWREIVASEIRHLSALLQERVPSRATPQEFLVLAAQLDRNPPWLDAARADAEARALLPPEALNWYSAAGEAPASILKNPGQSGASPQSKGGKHRPDDEIVAIYVAAALHENGVKPPRIVERLNEMNLPGKRDAVGRWLKKMGDPKQGPGVEPLLSNAGRTREELEGLRAKAVSRTEKLRSSS